MIGTDPGFGSPPTRLVDALREHPSELMLYENRRASELVRDLSTLVERFSSLALCNGEIVAIELDNELSSVLGLLLLLHLECACLVLAPGTPTEERARIVEANYCTREIVIENGSPEVHGRPSARHPNGAGILLATSGSTGAVKYIHRSEQSLRDEALRYQKALRLKQASRILIHAPIAHAYAMGWLFASLWAGCALTLVKPTHFSRVAHELSKAECWMATTPSLARLLARRRLPNNPSSAGGLHVMVGAGPVDAELDALFRDRFGVSLARNYGSSETGAVCCGPAGLPYGCVGSAMPGLEVRTVTLSGEPCVEKNQGLLEVRLENGSWHAMGDLATINTDGLVTLHGRRSRSVRRGDQWVSPIEIEQVASAFPAVRAAMVSTEPADDAQGDRLILHVWPYHPDLFDAEALHIALHKALSSAKWPNEVRVHSRLRQSASGKVQAPPAYRLAGAAPLLEASRAYKRSELTFALHRLGVLERLTRGATAHEIAKELGLNALVLEIALEEATRLGILVHADAREERYAETTNRLVELEYALSQSWTTRERIMHALQVGLHRRSPLAGAETILPFYQAAMHGDIARFRRTLALRRLGWREPKRFLEITSGPGDYCVAVAERWSSARTTLWQVGALQGPAHEKLRQAPRHASIEALEAGQTYDTCVIFNAIHLSEVASQLAAVWGALALGGQLVIDDLFLQEDAFSAELGIDWLTHGGNALRTLPELRDVMEHLGARVEVVKLRDAPHVNLLFASKMDASS